MNPQLLPPAEIADAQQPLWTIGTALVLTALVIIGLALLVPESSRSDSIADAFTLISAD